MEIKTIEQRARAFNHLFDAVMMTDPSGIITDWNNAAETLFGYSSEEAIGQPVSVLYLSEESERIMTEICETVDEGEQWNSNLAMKNKAGHICLTESIFAPLYDDDQQLLGTIGTCRNISDVGDDPDQFNHLAHYDQLTELPNRYLLLDRVTHLIEQAERYKTEFAMLYLDLDNFKDINDSHSHSFGDRILQTIAEKLSTSIRNSDTLARFGGDEFVILLENTADQNDISMITNVLSDVLRQPINIDNEKIRVTGSIGIAIYPVDGNTTDDLLVAADMAMYQAKEMGKDTFVFKGYLKSP